MPIYEYQCHACQAITTRERKPQDRHRKTKCRHCGGFHTELVISPCGFCLLGGGWAAAGYSSGGGKKNSKK